eukprot:6106024-Amphidinium_carterae.2
MASEGGAPKGRVLGSSPRSAISSGVGLRCRLRPALPRVVGSWAAPCAPPAASTEWSCGQVVSEPAMGRCANRAIRLSSTCPRSSQPYFARKRHT